MTELEQLREDIDDLRSQIHYAQEAIIRGEDIRANEQIVRVSMELLERAEAALEANVKIGL